MSSTISLALLCALLLSSSYLLPPLFPLAWFALAPLFWIVVRADSWRRALLRGWLAGFFTHLLGFYWLVHTISVFGEFPYSISVVVFLIYAALQGLQMALFAALVKQAGLGPLCVLPAFFWVAIEFWFPLLFPWYLANSQEPFLTFIQSADLVGPYGASFLIMWFNTAAFEALLSWRLGRPVRWHALPPVALCVIASVVYGTLRLHTVTSETANAAKLSLAAVQGNIDIDLKWNPLQVRHNLQTYQDLTKQTDGAALVIWPETAVELWLPEKLAQLPPEVMPSLNAKTFLIFGARSYHGHLSGPDFKAFNTAFLSDGKGRILGHYHKQVLLAFGEYLPFSGILSKLPAVPFADGFTPGDGPHTLDLPGPVHIAPLICYEDLMPELSRAFVKSGKANVLVNLTNDAWYGRTVASWQHARLAQWRAIETRRTLVRVTNTGVTTVIDAKGEMSPSLPLFTAAVLKADVPLLDGETLYVRFGDWFAWSATLISLAALLLCWKRTSWRDSR
ncbi:MAG: apolipoprotein N-acyltransferase [Alphaproteobacteria bacterium]